MRFLQTLWPLSSTIAKHTAQHRPALSLAFRAVILVYVEQRTPARRLHAHNKYAIGLRFSHGHAFLPGSPILLLLDQRSSRITGNVSNLFGARWTTRACLRCSSIC